MLISGLAISGPAGSGPRQYDLFSVDDHIIEPPDVWSTLPAKYRDAGPHVIEEDGREYWVYEGRRGETMGLNAVAGKDHATSTTWTRSASPT